MLPFRAALARPHHALPAAAQDFTPVVFASIHDEPRDGMGDSFNGSPFEGLLREQTTREDRAIQEFDVSSLSGMPIASATISGRITVNNSFDVGVRVFDFLLYEGNGAADLTDFEIPATLIGTDSYAPPADSTLLFSFDCTAAVQSLLLGGASFIGLKVDCASDPNFPNILTDGDTVLSISAGGSAGTPVCFGDGSGAPCGCGNESSPGGGAGCLNTAGVGAVLTAGGSPDTTADTFTLTADGVINQPGLFFQGNNTISGGAGTPFGDGVRCCGDTVVRIEVVDPPGTTSPATAQMTETATTNGPAGTIQPGDKKCYQYWYRDPAGGGVCGSSFNLSSAMTVTWF